MSSIVVEAQNISKRFQIGARQQRHDTLRDALTSALRSSVSRLRQKGRLKTDPPRDVVWALKDVSFRVERGEVLGIIGHNGAGKSTLLKILARITRPTCGYAQVIGRVGSLLEVGTGFHPELTGRENIYLNGAIVGMRRRDVERRFDEIVAFAEIEQFLDTPVKRYSSGMYVRLAFSVAAHLEPDILLVDEVLAVGDARFHSKCMQRIRDIHNQGTTILLVTHSMWQVQTVCSRALCLQQGKIVSDGSPLTVIADYRKMAETGDDFRVSSRSELADCGWSPEFEQCQAWAKILALEIQPDDSWASANTAFPESGMWVAISALTRNVRRVRSFVRVTSPDGFPYFTVWSDVMEVPRQATLSCRANLPHLMLVPGSYVLYAGLCAPDDSYHILAEGRIPFAVQTPNGQLPDIRSGVVWNKADWELVVTPGR